MNAFAWESSALITPTPGPTALRVLRQAFEQADLGPAIRVERAVEVEVLVRQVGEDRAVVVDARDAIRGEAVRARLDDGRLLAGIGHLAQDPLELEGAGCRVRLLVADQVAADPDADRPDQPSGESRSGETRRGEERGRGLAIRARHADGQQLAARVAVPPRRRGGEGRRSPIDDELRNRQLAGRCLDDDGDRPALDRLADERVAIRSQPTNRDEQVAWLDPARVVRDAGQFDRRRAGAGRVPRERCRPRPPDIEQPALRAQPRDEICEAVCHHAASDGVVAPAPPAPPESRRRTRPMIDRAWTAVSKIRAPTGSTTRSHAPT